MILVILLKVVRKQTKKEYFLRVWNLSVLIEVVIARNHNAKNVTVSVIHLVLPAHNNVVVWVAKTRVILNLYILIVDNLLRMNF